MPEHDMGLHALFTEPLRHLCNVVGKVQCAIEQHGTLPTLNISNTCKLHPAQHAGSMWKLSKLVSGPSVKKYVKTLAAIMATLSRCKFSPLVLVFLPFITAQVLLGHTHE